LFVFLSRRKKLVYQLLHNTTKNTKKYDISQFGSEWLVGLRATTLTKISATTKDIPPQAQSEREREREINHYGNMKPNQRRKV